MAATNSGNRPNTRFNNKHGLYEHGRALSTVDDELGTHLVAEESSRTWLLLRLSDGLTNAGFPVGKICSLL